MSIVQNDNALIRPVRLEDVDAIWELEREIVREGEYFIAVSEEFDKTVEQQREWISRVMESERETVLVAEIDGGVVGVIGFSSPNRKRLAHTGSMMMISKDHRSKGLGKMLLQELLAWAEQHPLIEKVSLGVLSTNHRAIALYKKMGFVEEGRKVKEFKMSENEYVDDVLMYKFV
ncbi:GNAT family N-acetyltransferase [Brevibacillus reuszeri]|uniref:GNAT family N-acetyltransferase n=1 Tax=Brevibacillus reuszeri TaxID=54915 RepID=UPI000CCBF0EA|nr:GNAT family N-acetyltransferase [Brevibacillus reuszeri]